MDEVDVHTSPSNQKWMKLPKLQRKTLHGTAIVAYMNPPGTTPHVRNGSPSWQSQEGARVGRRS